MEANDRAARELVALRRRHVFEHGLVLAVVRPATDAVEQTKPGTYFPSPHLVWQDVPDGSVTLSEPLAFDGSEMRGLVGRLDEAALAVFPGGRHARDRCAASSRSAFCVGGGTSMPGNGGTSRETLRCWAEVRPCGALFIL